MMKKYIVCKKIEDNSYVLSASNDESLGTLFIFLTDGTELNYFQNWLKNIDEKRTGTNICILKKKNENIEIGLDPNIFEAEDIISLSRKNFSEVIDQWEKLYHEGWQEIIITQDDSGVHLEGKNNTNA